MSRPDKIDGLKLWWDADDISTINDGRVVDGSNVYKWTDKVGRYVLTNGAGLKGPTYSVGKVNRRNTISFTYFDSTVSTVASLKRLTSFPNTIPPLSGGNYTVFIVCLPNDVRLRADDTYPTVNDSLVVFNILDSSRAGALPVDGTVYDRAMYTTTWNNVARVLGVNGDKPTAVIGSNKLTFASIPYSNQNPPALKVGATLATTPVIPANTTITDITGLTISMSNNALQAPVGGADIGIILQTPNRNTTIGYYESQGGTSYRGFRTDKITDNNESVNSGKLYMYGKATIFNYRFGSNTKKSGFLRDDYFLHDQFRPPVPRYENNVAANTITNPVLTIGAGWSIDTTVRVGSQLNPFEGEMCEFLWYDRLLTDPELNSVESYLKQKWIPEELPLSNISIPNNPDFVITIDTTNGDGLNRFAIGTNPSFIYNYTVKWEKTTDPTVKGTQNVTTSSSYIINFPSSGRYKISISGTFPQFYSLPADLADPFFECAQKVVSIDNWGTQVWQSMENSFTNCGLGGDGGYNATDVPNLSNITSLFEMFAFTDFRGNNSLSNWNVSNILNMSGMFRSTKLEGDITNWDTRNVQDFSNMFVGSSFNQNISSWNTSSAYTMESMFSNTLLFNQDISTWNTSNVVNMSYMFAASYAFNQNLLTNGNSWNVSNVFNFDGMFTLSKEFNGDISNWTINPNEGVSMREMFNGALKFNRNISLWNVSGVTQMIQIFRDTKEFNQNISNWKLKSLPRLQAAGMFLNALKFNQNLSTMCTPLILSKPVDFDTGAVAWTNQLWRPIWGSLCPP